jgi:phosphoglucosamine mutase
VGRLTVYQRAEKYYVDMLTRTFPLDLAGLTVVLDCANGATYRVGPSVFRRLGARVITICARPDGTNINAGCGALHPEGLRRRLMAAKADVGFAFDGDGDRLISVDHLGEIRDGDYALAIAGRHLAARGRLKANTVVTTVMANLGLDECLTAAGIRVVKTQVGDRYVHEEMLKIGANVGGEQSGHLLFHDHAPTGDGILSALALLSVIRETGEPLASLATCMRKFPQVLVNVPVARKPPIDTLAGLTERIRAFERELDGGGRILVRYSGTESLARVMIEGADDGRIRVMADELASALRTELGA